MCGLERLQVRASSSITATAWSSRTSLTQHTSE
jgi:hypothetical protein